jgi:hypothetical protein
MKKEKNFYKKSSPCTITPQDIYDNTNFFKEKQPQLKSYKLAFISSIIVVFLSFTMITILSIQNYNLKNKGPEVQYIFETIGVIDDTQGMSKEEKEDLNRELTYFEEYAICSFVHDTYTIVYLYYGYNLNSDNTKVYNYYYALGLDDYKSTEVKLIIDGNEITINNSYRTGFLTSIDGSITNDFTLRFTVSTSDRTALYVLNNCDY